MSRILPILALLFALALSGCKEGREYAETVVGAMDRAQATEVKASLQVLASSLESYQIDHGRYPDRLADLPDVASGRMRSEDPWGNELRYRPSGAGYEVVCLGPDGELGTEDDVALRDGRVE
jgi:type II secretory pathway pseudopilin PulG